jgi:protease IV
VLERAKDATHNAVTQLDEARRRRRGPIVLELDLTEPLVEGVPQDPVGALIARRRTALRTVFEGLRRGGRDPRVRALVVKVGGPRSPLALARAQELRDAIGEFRQRGKRAIAWAETFGESDRGTAPYVLAAGCDEIWLQPSGDLCLTGVGAEVPFVRGTLDKLGITPELAQRHEYKSVANVFTEQGFTAAHREATERVVRSMMEQVVSGISDGRGLDRGDVEALIDRAPLSSSEALAARLIDRVGYRDEVYAAVRDAVGEDPALQYIARYQKSRAEGLSQRVSRQSDIVALIHVIGPIHLGRSVRQPLGMHGAGSDTVISALGAAAGDDAVKAIVLRVDSPGGSYVASDAIWRGVGEARRHGKPVVASLGDVAASGGYYVSMAADAIVAEPGTITGSIGVVGGKQVLAGLSERVGVSHESVAGAEHALMFSVLQGFTPDEWEHLNAWLDRVYDDFTAKVAAGRGLSVEQVGEVAKGRVWTGADAKDRGLVDELGGFAAAVAIAKDRAAIPESVEPTLRVFPKVGLAARLRPARSSEDPAAAAVGLRLDGWGAFAGLAARVGLPASGPLTLPPPFLQLNRWL